MMYIHTDTETGILLVEISTSDEYIDCPMQSEASWLLKQLM